MSLRTLPETNLLFVPCFCHRDMPAAISFAKKRNIPLVFDPLISAYDKQVYERKKFSPDSIRAKILFSKEKKILHGADLVIADTEEHARYFHDFFSVQRSRLAVVPVGANESIFTPAPQKAINRSEYTVLFYGSFLSLQNPQIIVKAAQLDNTLPVKWKFVGEGPLLEECRRLAARHENIEFIPWVPYEDLPGIIQSADIVLGIFGTSDKARRVIPNKVYQTLACGKPLITMTSPAYPSHFINNEELGIQWVEAGNARQLADAVATLIRQPQKLVEMGANAYATYKKFFSETDIKNQLAQALSSLQ